MPLILVYLLYFSEKYDLKRRVIVILYNFNFNAYEIRSTKIDATIIIDAINSNRNVIDCKENVIVRVID